MNVFLTILSLLVSFVIGSVLVGATATCYAQHKYSAYGIGFMFSTIIVAIIFRLIMAI